MRRNHPTLAVLAIFVLSAGFTWAIAAEPVEVRDLPKRASDQLAEGQAAWVRIHNVLSHPRCVNCHVGADNIPLWTTTTSTTDRVHGMHIDAGNSRVGAATLNCNSCHQTSTRPNTVAHAAPHTGMAWRLAPLEFQWVGKSSAAICEQLRDPQRNGGRDAAGLLDHILHDAKVGGFITWSFNPGPGREPPPGSMQDHLSDMVVWTEAGMPCPT